MGKKQASLDHQKYRFTISELLELFQHFDQIHAGKENLFVPIILAAIPAILATWKDVSAPVVGVAGFASSLLYLYHVLVTRRFSAIQGGLFRKIREQTTDLDDIVAYPRILSITALRRGLFFALVLIWLLLYYLKATGL